MENASFKQRNVSASKTTGPLPSSYTNIYTSLVMSKIKTKRICNPVSPSKLEMEYHDLLTTENDRNATTGTMPEIVAASSCRSCSLYSHDQAWHA